ncbi:uncharacterized protein LOC112576876 isoform X2 [Pomacea canaliculata]|uniref:uncharacterized protein LOC112576876 isoform X2 n=1 Tax=Pomacea canaliculata TaxID=400727 RepID=UPI000D7382F0|nr:uncharacterized protein LOC112576876 isoform X2 [Pomacea canaliculata]
MLSIGHATEPLLQLADEIMNVSPETPVAPQVVLRKARVLKDNGDLNGAMRILNKIFNKEHSWQYQSEEQVEDTKAACWHVEGQLYHNVGLWKQAVTPLVEALHLFKKVGDDKGIASCLDVLSRCLSRVGCQDYQDIRRFHQDVFRSQHPCYEAYEQATEAVKHVQHITAGFFSGKHQLVADESLLKYAVQQNFQERQRFLEKIVHEMRSILAGYQDLTFLHGVESFFGFVRTLFTICLVLEWSARPEDWQVAKDLEKISMDLYFFMCCELRGESGESMAKQTSEFILHINVAMGLLGLPHLKESGTNDASLLVDGDTKKICDLDLQRGEKDNKVLQDDIQIQTTNNQDHSISSQVSRSDSNVSLSPPSGSSGSTQDVQNSCKNEKTFPAAKTCDPTAAKAATFPAAATRSKIKPHDQGEVHVRMNQQPFVGAPLPREHLRSATYPVLTPEAEASLAADDSEDEGIVIDEESLSLSFNTLSSGSSQESVCQGLVDPSAFFDISLSSKCSVVNDDIQKNQASREGDLPKLMVPASQVSQDPTTDVKREEMPKTGAEFCRTTCSTVDLEATTEARSLASLRDLSEPLVSGLLNALPYSVDNTVSWTTWIPPADSKVHRAVLLSFNPETGEWSPQTTLTHVGQKLQTERKGAFRDVFHVSFLHQDEPLGRYVGKRYRKLRHRAIHTYMMDVCCQMLAGHLVHRFNQALTNCPDDFLQVQFLPAYHLQLCDMSGAVFDWLNVEPFMQGSFIKLTNNHRYAATTPEAVVATAFTHFSFVETRGALMVVDLQGWVPADKEGRIYLTDPVLHTRCGNRFSDCDRQEQGMKDFWEKVHPRCNHLCKFLGIDSQRSTF